jgi:hypothetical protein
VKELTPKEQKQLDKDLEWKLKRVKEETQEIKEAITRVDKEGRDFFQEFADFYNAGRDYFYKKLPAKLAYRGDFKTMEIHAQVSENYELILSGVWGCRHLTVKRIPEGFHLRLGDGVTEKKLKTKDELLSYLVDELLDDHPEVREVAEERYRKTEQLKKLRFQVTGASATEKT